LRKGSNDDGNTLEIDFLGGCYPTLNNKVLANVIHEAMLAAPKDPYTEEEIAFARALNQTTPKKPLPCAKPYIFLTT
jgi:aminobenzoyl-glutamate utilization protein B